MPHALAQTTQTENLANCCLQAMLCSLRTNELWTFTHFWGLLGNFTHPLLPTYTIGSMRVAPTYIMCLACALHYACWSSIPILSAVAPQNCPAILSGAAPAARNGGSTMTHTQ